MLKFYKEVGEGLLMMLTWMRKYWKDNGLGVSPSLRDIREDLYRWMERAECPLSRYSKTILMSAVEGGNSEPIELDGMIEKLEEQLKRANTGKGEKDLLDVVVDILQLPYLNSRLTNKVLKQLRDAVLVPEEARKLKSVIEAGEIKCGSCGKRMGHGEMGSLNIGAGGVKIICTRCQVPVFFACKNCDGGVPVPDSVVRTIGRKTECKVCKEKASVESAPGYVGLRVPGGGVGIAGGGGVFVINEPIPVPPIEVPPVIDELINNDANLQWAAAMNHGPFGVVDMNPPNRADGPRNVIRLDPFADLRHAAPRRLRVGAPEFEIRRINPDFPPPPVDIDDEGF